MLIEKIERAIQGETMKADAMGSVTIELQLTSREKEDFLKLSYFNNANYFWELDDNILTITYKNTD